MRIEHLEFHLRMPALKASTAFTAQASSNLLDWGDLPGTLSITNGLSMLNEAGFTEFWSTKAAPGATSELVIT
jgi:hypothetical protein